MKLVHPVAVYDAPESLMFEGMESVDVAQYAVVGIEDHEVAPRLCDIY